jgi:hypothetical protein
LVLLVGEEPVSPGVTRGVDVLRGVGVALGVRVGAGVQVGSIRYRAVALGVIGVGVEGVGVGVGVTEAQLARSRAKLKKMNPIGFMSRLLSGFGSSQHSFPIR